jgi:hypothetical protein
VPSDHRRRFLNLGAATCIFTTGNRVLDHRVGDHESNTGGNRSEPETKVATIQQQRMIFSAIRRNELVHNAAIRSDKFILGALAKAGQPGARITDSDQ